MNLLLCQVVEGCCNNIACVVLFDNGFGYDVVAMVVCCCCSFVLWLRWLFLYVIVVDVVAMGDVDAIVILVVRLIDNGVVIVSKSCRCGCCYCRSAVKLLLGFPSLSR